MMSRIGLHKFADVFFGITQELLYYIIKLGQIIYIYNDARISGFAIMKKALSPWKKIFEKKKKKKSFQLICTDKIYKTGCGNFLKINGSWNI